MKINRFLFSALLLFVVCCSNSKSPFPRLMETAKKSLGTNTQTQILLPSGKTILERFDAPEGFVRVSADSSSFAHHLRSLPLKPHGTPVKYFNGTKKTNTKAYVAVVDLDIGKRDLHQCADAVMRVRAEYLWHKKAYGRIHFNFTNGFRADYHKWMNGNRIKVSGNSVKWVTSGTASRSYANFWKYLEMVFAYAGTLSLAKEMKAVHRSQMEIGDVFIIGGSPGHAVIIVDMAKNEKTGKQLFMLAQSYMPAQDLQILANPNNTQLSPWYELDFGEMLITPEWNFKAGDLKRFTN